MVFPNWHFMKYGDLTQPNVAIVHDLLTCDIPIAQKKRHRSNGERATELAETEGQTLL